MHAYGTQSVRPPPPHFCFNELPPSQNQVDAPLLPTTLITSVFSFLNSLMSVTVFTRMVSDNP